MTSAWSTCTTSCSCSTMSRAGAGSASSRPCHAPSLSQRSAAPPAPSSLKPLQAWCAPEGGVPVAAQGAQDGGSRLLTPAGCSGRAPVQSVLRVRGGHMGCTLPTNPPVRRQPCNRGRARVAPAGSLAAGAVWGAGVAAPQARHQPQRGAGGAGGGRPAHGLCHAQLPPRPPAPRVWAGWVGPALPEPVPRGARLAALPSMFVKAPRPSPPAPSAPAASPRLPPLLSCRACPVCRGGGAAGCPGRGGTPGGQLCMAAAPVPWHRVRLAAGVGEGCAARDGRGLCCARRAGAALCVVGGGCVPCPNAVRAATHAQRCATCHGLQVSGRGGWRGGLPGHWQRWRL